MSFIYSAFVSYNQTDDLNANRGGSEYWVIVLGRDLQRCQVGPYVGKANRFTAALWNTLHGHPPAEEQAGCDQTLHLADGSM